MKTIKLAGTKKGVITVEKIDEPYGENSNSVASIGINLKGETNNPDWKVHLPFENIEEVIQALKDLS